MAYYIAHLLFYWEGDRFESCSNSVLQLKTLTMVPTAAMSGAKHKELQYYGEYLGNSLPCTVRTSQTEVVQSKGCMMGEWMLHTAIIRPRVCFKVRGDFYNPKQQQPP